MPDEAPRISAQRSRESAIRIGPSMATLRRESSKRSDDAGCAKTLDCAGVVAGLREDLVGLLPEERRGRADRCGRRRELERDADLVDGAEHRVLQRDPRAERLGLWRAE